MKPKLKIVASNTPPEPHPAEAPPEQVEMPFAVVNGEPITQLPRDLYIPPQALEVFLEAFEGPLDLLLYLIRRQNLDVLDIPIAEITRQYMKYIEVMQDLQLELAGEYLVMAATLAEIKSRMLLPRAHADGQAGEEDPRAELVRRLQEYERFKQAAENIDSLPRLERDVWSASAELKERKVVRALPQVTLQEMLHAFKDVVVRSELFAHHHIERERLSVRARMTDILSSLERTSFVDFVRLFRPEEGRMGVTVTFVAVLELVREGLIDIVQAEPFAPLHVRAAGPNRGLRLVADNPALDQPSAAVEEVVVVESAESVQEPSAAELEVVRAFADEDDTDEEPAEPDAFLAELDAFEAEAAQRKPDKTVNVRDGESGAVDAIGTEFDFADELVAGGERSDELASEEGELLSIAPGSVAVIGSDPSDVLPTGTDDSDAWESGSGPSHEVAAGDAVLSAAPAAAVIGSDDSDALLAGTDDSEGLLAGDPGHVVALEVVMPSDAPAEVAMLRSDHGDELPAGVDDTNESVAASDSSDEVLAISNVSHEAMSEDVTVSDVPVDEALADEEQTGRVQTMQSMVEGEDSDNHPGQSRNADDEVSS